MDAKDRRIDELTLKLASMPSFEAMLTQQAAQKFRSMRQENASLLQQITLYETQRSNDKA